LNIHSQAPLKEKPDQPGEEELGGSDQKKGEKRKTGIKKGKNICGWGRHETRVQSRQGVEKNESCARLPGAHWGPRNWEREGYAETSRKKRGQCLREKFFISIQRSEGRSAEEKKRI